MLCSILSLRAQTFVKPAVKVKDTSFAVITDKGTFQACDAELKAYQEILGKEGLPTFIVYNEWNKPEDVKKVIVKLYKKDKLEGVVFVGDYFDIVYIDIYDYVDDDSGARRYCFAVTRYVY